MIGATALLAVVAIAIVAVMFRAPRDAIREAREELEAEGFTNVRVVGGSAARFELEGEREGERCTVRIEVLASGERRRATACEGAEPLEVLERACEGGELERCRDAAERARTTHPIDWPRATRSSLRACEGGLERECLFVGMAHELGGRGLERDLASARAYYERACAAGSPAACSRVRAGTPH